MDNRVLNINGSGIELLSMAIALAIRQADYSVSAWSFREDRGLLLLAWGDGVNRLMADTKDADALAKMVWEWLKGPQSATVKCEGWDADMDHDGHNSAGWRVYVEDWGKVGNVDGVICAIRPAHMWHGK